MCMTGFPGVALRAVFFPSVVKPRMLLLGRYVPEGQLSVAFAWLILLAMSPLRCVPFYCRQAVWCISWTSWFSPVVVQRQVPVLVRTVLSVACGDSTGAVLGRVYCHVNRWITDPEVEQVCLRYSALSLVRQRIHAVRHSTRLFWKNFTREGFRRPFRSAEADPMVLLFSRPQRFPSCRSFSGVDATVVQSCRFMSPSWRSGSSHGPDCSSDLLLPQLLYTVIDAPVCRSSRFTSPSWRRADSMVQTVRRTIFFPSEHGGRRPCCTGRSGSFLRRGTEAVSMVQTVRLTMDIQQLLITVADVPVARSCSSRVHTWRRQSSSTVALVENSSNGAAHHRDDELMG